jgi:hypothetical protein
MGKDKKGLNPADAFRREQKKHDAKKNKVAKQKVQEVRDLLNNPSKLEEKIKELQKESDENRLDKSLKDQIKQYKEMYEIALKKQKLGGTADAGDYDAPPSEPSRYAPSSSSAQHYGAALAHHPAPPSAMNLQSRRPDESIYYHPVYNPLGTPPPGQPQIYRPLPPPRVTSSGPRPQRPMGGPVMIPIGGQNGIPPPPPPRGLPPPLSAPPAFINGGVIPPPPPPIKPVASPYASFAPAVSPPTALESHSHGRRMQAAGSSSAAAIDPLDPNNLSYLHRFNDEPKRQPQPMPHPVPQLQQQPELKQQEPRPEPPSAPVVAPEPKAEEPELMEFSLNDPIALNIEDIMRRRFQIPVTEEEDETAAAAAGDEDEAEGGETVGPRYQDYDVGAALPSAEELLRQQGILLVNHDDDDDQQSAAAVTASKPSSLAILGDYGDDSDADEEDEKVSATTPVQHAPDYANTFLASSTTAAAATAPALSALAPATANSNLKTMKANANLTKFVPSTLLVKRTSATANLSSSSAAAAQAPPAKLLKINTEPSTSATSMPATTASVDDAYQRFLDEIQALGG